MINQSAKEVVNQILSQDSNEYCGLVELISKFQNLAEKKLRRDKILGTKLETCEVNLPSSILNSL